MKKIIAMLLTLAMVFSLAACSGGNTASGGSVSVKDPVELLQNVWDKYAEDEKFPAIGGDFSEENMRDNAPGAYALEDANAVDTALGFPAAEVGNIDAAASIVHMMNVNTFTGAAYHVKSGVGIDAVAEAVRTNLQGRMWMCGFPDKMAIYAVGDYVVVAFGAQDLVDGFVQHVTEAYPTAEKKVDEPIQ